MNRHRLNQGDAVTFEPPKDVLFLDGFDLAPALATLLSCPESEDGDLIGITVEELGPDNVRFVDYDAENLGAARPFGRH